MDRIEGTLRLASQTLNVLSYLPPSNLGKMASQFASLQVKKLKTKLIVCGVHYLTVLVHTKTTIHLSVGG